jgi:hypothetical protein
VIDADRLVRPQDTGHPAPRDPRAIAAHVSLSSRSLVKERRSQNPSKSRQTPRNQHPFPDAEPQKTARQHPLARKPPSSFTPRTYGSETRRPQDRPPSGKPPPAPPRGPRQTPRVQRRNRPPAPRRRSAAVDGRVIGPPKNPVNTDRQKTVMQGKPRKSGRIPFRHPENPFRRSKKFVWSAAPAATPAPRPRNRPARRRRPVAGAPTPDFARSSGHGAAEVPGMDQLSRRSRASASVRPANRSGLRWREIACGKPTRLAAGRRRATQAPDFPRRSGAGTGHPDAPGVDNRRPDPSRFRPLRRGTGTAGSAGPGRSGRRPAGVGRTGDAGSTPGQAVARAEGATTLI